MSVYILLPPLHLNSEPLTVDTPVYLAEGSQPWRVMPFKQAAQSYRKAVVLIHAVDAPMLRQTLPPLPKSKRETALKVMLEDRILSDIQTMSLAILPLGGHAFAVAYCDRSLLNHVQALLQTLGVQHAISTLSAHLPIGLDQYLPPWHLWSNQDAAGASPMANEPLDPLLDTQLEAVHSDTVFNALRLQASALQFVSNTAKRQRWQFWRWVVYALIACVGVGLLGQWLYWRTVNAQNAVQQRVNAAFQKALPKTPQSKNPLAQVQAAVNGPSTNSALSIAMGKVPNDIPANVIKGFEWKSGTLQMSVKRSWSIDAATKTALIQRLAADKITLLWVE